MGMLDIFRKRRKVTAEDLRKLYSQVIDRMWVCVVRFRPWDKEEHDVVFKEVDIVKAEATPNGILVEADERDPFREYETSSNLTGYLDRFTHNWHWVGFFETKAQAENSYNAMMDEWIGVIQSKMANTTN